MKDARMYLGVRGPFGLRAVTVLRVKDFVFLALLPFDGKSLKWGLSLLVEQA